MKKQLLAIFIICCLFPAYGYAKSGLISFGGEEIIKIAELPDEESYKTEDGEYVDIGYIYKSVSILFVPIWNYDGRLCGYVNKEGSYLILSDDQINDLATSAGVTIPDEPYLDGWQLYGGKLVFLLAIVSVIVYFKRKSDNQSAYISASATVKERIRDIVVDGLNFVPAIDSSENEVPSELYYSGHKNYFMSFMSVSIIEADNLSIDEIKSIVDRYFDYVFPLRKIMSSKSSASIAYPLFIFTKSPREALRKEIIAYKKRKIMKKTNCFPVIIDTDAQIVYAPKGMYPSKKALQNSFIQAKPANSVDSSISQEN